MPELGSTIRSDEKEFEAFLVKVDVAQEEFARGRPGEFKALWSHTDDVSLSGGHGGLVELGWEKVAARLDWASSTYVEGDRSNEIITRCIGGELAYLVRKEIIEARIGGEADRSRQELRVTMVFRRGAKGWQIVHRHADSQAKAALPR